jgi:hypothetical protein
MDMGPARGITGCEKGVGQRTICMMPPKSQQQSPQIDELQRAGLTWDGAIKGVEPYQLIDPNHLIIRSRNHSPHHKIT